MWFRGYREAIELAFQATDLASLVAVTFDDDEEPSVTILAGERRGDDVGVEFFEASESALHLALGGEPVADVGGEFRHLVSDVVEHQRA